MIWLTTFVLIIVIKYSIKKSKSERFCFGMIACSEHDICSALSLDWLGHPFRYLISSLNVALCMRLSIPIRTKILIQSNKL